MTDVPTLGNSLQLANTKPPNSSTTVLFPLIIIDSLNRISSEWCFTTRTAWFPENLRLVIHARFTIFIVCWSNFHLSPRCRFLYACRSDGSMTIRRRLIRRRPIHVKYGRGIASQLFHFATVRSAIRLFWRFFVIISGDGYASRAGFCFSGRCVFSGGMMSGGPHTLFLVIISLEVLRFIAKK